MALLEPVELSCQVLVIGGGLAASCAARVANSVCPDVLVVSKGRYGRSGSSPRRVSAFAHQDAGPPFRGNPSVMLDTWVMDILETGQLINDQHVVDLVTEDANDHFSWSEWFGFAGRAREPVRDGQGGRRRPLRFTAPGHSFARMSPFEDPLSGLYDGNREALEIWGGRVTENVMITRLLTAGGRVVGAAGFDVQSGQPYRISAGSTILCAGGADLLYHPRRGEGQTSGDALALAYQAGAPLSNMEFVQFNLYPAGPDGKPTPHNDDLLYLAMGGTLLNSKRDRFMLDAELLLDQVRLELAPPANLVSEVFRQQSLGLGPVHSPAGEIPSDHNGLPYLRSLAELPEWQEKGIDWTIGVDRLLGGLKVDYRCFSPLPGLWANGESATGACGADCLPGYGEAFTASGGSVSGAMAARAAVHFKPWADFPKEQALEEERKLEQFGSPGASIDIAELQETEDEFRTMAWRDLGIWRNEDGLRQAQQQFTTRGQGLAQRRAASVDDHRHKRELENIALTGSLIAAGALARQETRGQHRREDYPNRDDRVWLKEFLLTAGPSGPAIAEQPISLPRYKSRHVAAFENTRVKFPR
ncbi:MAG: succinate dehydrogenase, flavoprotein subunit (sdhA) [Chloroflexi bacterium]|nr:succinate dehydrogenase, flavoprotein subunit (sdhA) [Chloroflexota bacterium]